MTIFRVKWWSFGQMVHSVGELDCRVKWWSFGQMVHSAGELDCRIKWWSFGWMVHFAGELDCRVKWWSFGQMVHSAGELDCRFDMHDCSCWTKDHLTEKQSCFINICCHKCSIIVSSKQRSKAANILK